MPNTAFRWDARRAACLLAMALWAALAAFCGGCGGTTQPQEFHSVSERTSSDNTSTVFAAFAGTGQLFVYRIPNAGGNAALLTQPSNDGNPNNDGGIHPFFSPDGSTVVYVANDSGNRDIFTIDRNGGSRTQLTTDSGADMQPCFSPDGSQIAWVSNRGGTNDIWIMDSDGSNQQQLTNSAADEQWPSVGPSSKLAFQSDSGVPGGDTDIYTANIPGSGLATGITNITPSGSFNEGAPSWDPTGTGGTSDEILYHSDQAGSFDIWKMNADGSSPGAIVSAPLSAGFPVWFPDGTRFTFTIAREAWHALPDGTDQKRITVRFPS